MFEMIAMVAVGLLGLALFVWAIVDGRATRRALSSGRASLETLSDYLGRGNVAEIEAEVGPPDDEWRYDTSSWRRLRRAWVARIFDNRIIDAAGVGLALVGILTRSWWLVPVPLAWFGLAIFFTILTDRRALERDGELAHCILLPLGSSLENAERAWGPYEEDEADDDSADDVKVFIFDLSSTVGAQVTVFQGAIHRITYATTNKNPTADLARIFTTYGSKGDWNEMTPGYSYRRKDGEVLVWCSAMPMTTVVSETYWRHTSERKTAGET